MKIIWLPVAFIVLSAPALAQSSECQSVQKASERLACYDRAAPPSKANKPIAVDIPTVPEGQFVDKLAIENKLLDAKIKNICRGC